MVGTRPTRPPWSRLSRRGRRRGVRPGARPARPAASPGPARLRAARRAARVRPQAQHPRLPRLASRYRILGRIPRLPKIVVASIVQATGGSMSCWAPARGARGHRGRRRDPRQGHPRGTPASAGDQPRGSVSADVTMCARGTAGLSPAVTKEDIISEEKDDLMTEDLEAIVVEHIEFELGDSVVYPHHGAGRSSRRKPRFCSVRSAST